jgi:hypothetical protein
MEIDVTCHLEAFRRFLINSTCRSFIPESYLRDPEVFPEKEMDPGSIYIEAADKVTLKKFRDITFVNANEVLGIIYTSKSGHSKLKWRQQSGPMGRVTGDASQNSLVNLSMARVLSPEYIEELMSRQAQGEAPVQESPNPPTAERSVQEENPPPSDVAQVEREAASILQPPDPGKKMIPPDEEEDDFDAADADDGEQDDLDEQAREETV